MSAFEVIKKKYGKPLRVKAYSAIVGTTAIKLLPNNPDRIFYLVCNLGSYNVYVGYDAHVSSTRGIKVQSDGGIFQSYYEYDGPLVTQELYAISPSGAVNVYVVTVEVGV